MTCDKLGTDIQVKLFDDHITVESPGILPGLVRPYNIREMHFSRNPKIALYMRSYKLVKEFGEGVDRMFREMAEAGLPAPEYRQNEFMVYATIRQAKDAAGQVAGNGDVNGGLNGQLNGQLSGTLNGTLNGTLSGTLNERQKSVLDFIAATPGVQAQVLIDKLLIPRDTLNKIIKTLTDRGLIERRGSKKTGGYYVTENKNENK